MLRSKYNSELVIDETNWIVSLVNTGKGLSGLFGGHAKIVVEGLKKSTTLFSNELFYGEYHIMEVNEQLLEQLVTENNEGEKEESSAAVASLFPQFLKNTKCKYTIAYVEENQYSLSDEQYKKAFVKSWQVPADDVKKMIAHIKAEQVRIASGLQEPKFQYAGKWCIYSYNGGHNCTTWAEEKLALCGAGNGQMMTDSSKAAPSLHVTCLLF